MENYLKSKGLRSFLIKTVIFLAIGMSVALFIQVYFRYTPFFKEYLTIPKVFTLEPPNFRTNLINSLILGFIAFIIVSHKKLKKLKDFPFEKNQVLFALLPIVFLILQYASKYMIAQNLDFFLQMPKLWALLRVLINLGFIASLALAVYGYDFLKYFIKEYIREIIIFLSLSIGFLVFTLAFQNLWHVFSSIISEILYWFFRLFFEDVTYTRYVPSATMSEGGGPLLGIASFSAIIGKPCSGIDSFLFFTAVYILIIAVDHKRLKPIPSIIGYPLGALGMFFTNMIRILLLYIIGAYVNPEFALGLFHSNIGWILFIIYFYIFFSIARKFIYKR
ncbi:archaeosortase/exosortase family protein [Candidatus Woesearchaeota archaeon]|nr:archaeosortase/exosortase family protein [Candidatus Woesearchaeota archaeon]